MTGDGEREATLVRLRADLEKAQKKSMKAAEARWRLPPGSARARVTTANARWAQAAEARDRIQEKIERLENEGEAAP